MAQDSVSDVERLRAALQSLESACDDLAANRSRETYQSMIHCDRATPYLEALDQARCDAREVLRALAVPINKIGEDARERAKDCAVCGGVYDDYLGFTLHENRCAALTAQTKDAK